MKLRCIARPRWQALCVICLALLAGAAPSFALDVVSYPLADSAMDHRRDYPYQLLTEVLRRTEPQFGPYQLKTPHQSMERKRIYAALQSGAPINVSSNTYSAEWARDLIAVPVPIDLGLQTWLVALIDQRHQAGLATLARADNLAAFKRLRAGGGSYWISLAALKASGFEVVAGDSYEGLFDMLLAGRFDYFPRGLNEIYAEFDQRRAASPYLALERSFVLHNRVPPLFFVSPKTPQLARRIHAGLEAMLRDGSLERFMLDYFGDDLRRAALCQRRVIEVPNLDLDPAILARRELWFDPFDPRHGLCTRKAKPARREPAPAPGVTRRN